MPAIERDNLAGLIPEPVSREIFQGVVESSSVLKVGRRLPNMTSQTQSINVLDMLPIAYWVNGDMGFKQTAAQAWEKKTLHAGELAVIVPIPEAVLADSNYDIWGEVKPRIVEAMGRRIDEAILFGVGKPTIWRKGIVPTAADANMVVTATSDLFADIMGENGLIAKVEQNGYLPTRILSGISMRAKLRSLRDEVGNPIFLRSMQAAAQYDLDGIPLTFPMNGAWDESEALMITGDFSQLVFSIRQDVTYKVLTEATIVDPTTREVVYSLAQQDMVALRAVLRLAWEIPNPVSAYRSDLQTYSPFAVLQTTLLTEENFPKYALRADSFLDLLTTGRYEKDCLPEKAVEAVKMAECAIAEVCLNLEQAETQSDAAWRVQGEKVGNHSVQFRNSAEIIEQTKKQIQEIATHYLLRWGLLYRGCGCG